MRRCWSCGVGYDPSLERCPLPFGCGAPKAFVRSAEIIDNVEADVKALIGQLMQLSHVARAEHGDGLAWSALLAKSEVRRVLDAVEKLREAMYADGELEHPTVVPQ